MERVKTICRSINICIFTLHEKNTIVYHAKLNDFTWYLYYIYLVRMKYSQNRNMLISLLNVFEIYIYKQNTNHYFNNKANTKNM